MGIGSEHPSDDQSRCLPWGVPALMVAIRQVALAHSVARLLEIRQVVANTSGSVEQAMCGVAELQLHPGKQAEWPEADFMQETTAIAPPMLIGAPGVGM